MAIRKLQGEKEKDEGVYYIFDTEADILGEGGMGRVYLGKRIDKDNKETKVAIKAMFEDLPELVIERAKREASIHLYNDSLVFMYAFIETKDRNELGEDVSHYHVISEYLDGISLANLIKGNLNDRFGNVHPFIEKFYKEYIVNREIKSTEIIKKVLSGVMALHDSGYIHRDIDPSNIIVTTDGKIKLIDFGVAKQLIRLNETDRELTFSGQFLGKAGYAAPELILGDIQHQNYSTDVYAVGILYYQLLTGQMPFCGTTFDMMESQLKKLIPLSKIHSRQIKDVIKKATAKKQLDRYITASQFRAAIDVFKFPEPTHISRFVKVLFSLCLLIFSLGCFYYIKYSSMKEFMPNNTTEILYKKYLTDLNSNEPTRTSSGFIGMLELAEKGNVLAMYQIAYTYMWAPKDSLSLLRKKNLGLSTDKIGLLIDNSKNEEAITWMKKIIQATDSTSYRPMSWLSQYYLNGMVVNTDIEEAIRLLRRSREEALKNKDKDFVEKIDKVLLRIKMVSNNE